MPPANRDLVPFREAVRTWGAISLQTFGGPAGQIAVMQRVLVDEKRWIGQQRFLHALSFCMLLPGPEAQQLAVYTGWLLNGTRGGLVAGTLFVLPGVVALLALAAIYVDFGDTALLVAVFSGLAPAVLAIVTQAVVRIGGRAAGRPAFLAIAVSAFVAIAVLGVPFPVVVAGAGLAGWALGRWVPHVVARDINPDTGAAPPVIRDDALHEEAPSAGRSARILALGAVAWLVPLWLAVAALGAGSTVARQGVFFSGTALISFGGAYAVLTFVAQRAVEVYGWVTPGEMVRGLALAETTPGPLIMVVQFVAFLGAYHAPGQLNPWLAALVGALLTTWVTFVPCFIFIFLGAPYVERLRGNAALTSALAGVTAAIVGVIANLAFFFAVHTLFDQVRAASWSVLRLEVPVWSTVRLTEVAISAAAFVMVFAARWSVLRTLGACAALGLLAPLLPR